MFGRREPDDPLERLRALGFLGEREVRQTKALEAGLAFVDLDRVRPDPSALASMPVELARELRVLPIKRNRETLWVAMDEFDASVLERAKAATGLRVMPALCVPKELDAALARWDAKG